MILTVPKLNSNILKRAQLFWSFVMYVEISTFTDLEEAFKF